MNECEEELSDIRLKSYESSGDFKRDLGVCLQDAKAQAFIMGTRRSDPNGIHAERFEPSSGGWPPFMRINPILDWTYANVWSFLRHLNLRYCELYDRGYTSVGAIANTHPNPRLKNANGTYRPAYELENGFEERLGRWDRGQGEPNAGTVVCSNTVCVHSNLSRWHWDLKKKKLSTVFSNVTFSTLKRRVSISSQSFLFSILQQGSKCILSDTHHPGL